MVFCFVACAIIHICIYIFLSLSRRVTYDIYINKDKHIKNMKNIWHMTETVIINKHTSKFFPQKVYKFSVKHVTIMWYIWQKIIMKHVSWTYNNYMFRSHVSYYRTLWHICIWGLNWDWIWKTCDTRYTSCHLECHWMKTECFLHK